MKIVINVPDYVKEQADDGKGEELGIPLWLAYEIANGTPLDKIRAEIEEYKSRQLTLAIGVNDLEKGKQIALEYVLAIIDHYKGESEG